MSELIQMERKSWKEEFIRQIFLPVHADTILGIPLSIRLPGDRIIWAELITAALQSVVPIRWL